MKITLVFGILFLFLLLVSCVPQQLTPEQDSEVPVSEVTPADREILQQYPDNLDAALEELEIVE